VCLSIKSCFCIPAGSFSESKICYYFAIISLTPKTTKHYQTPPERDCKDNKILPKYNKKRTYNFISP
ncbi:MAG: hypothetical protein LBC47_10380, partial [Tannerella sp.]|nr:hypothetical protein [Tannerella sp.]